MELKLTDLTPDNWRAINALKVKPEQQKYVAENITILARAFAYRLDNSEVHVVCVGDISIGVIMQRDWFNENRLICILDQFMIDGPYQGKGFGKKAMQLWMSMIKSEGKYDSIELCFVEGDIAAEKIYNDLGFIRRPELDDEDELVMVYKL